MNPHDDVSNVVPFTNDSQTEPEIETGSCFVIVRGGRQAMMLEIRLPATDDSNWRRIGIPYPLYGVEMSPSGIVIETHKGDMITIKGDRLDRIFDALCDHKLRRIRPGEEVAEDEPKITEINMGCS